MTWQILQRKPGRATKQKAVSGLVCDPLCVLFLPGISIEYPADGLHQFRPQI